MSYYSRKPTQVEGVKRLPKDERDVVGVSRGTISFKTVSHSRRRAGLGFHNHMVHMDKSESWRLRFLESCTKQQGDVS